MPIPSPGIFLTQWLKVCILLGSQIFYHIYIYIYMGIYIYIYMIFLIYILYICIWVAVLFVFVTRNADKTLSTSYRSPLDNCWWKLFDKKLSLLLPKASFLKHIMFPTWVYSLFKYLFTIMETQMMCSLIWLDKN